MNELGLLYLSVNTNSYAIISRLLRKLNFWQIVCTSV